MFKIVIGLFVVFGIASGASIGREEVTTEKKEIIGLLRFETDKKPDGSFTFSYEGEDQSFRQESGVVQDVGTDDEALEVSGSYRYIDADGNLVEVHYTAGKNGFVPVGTNILSEISAAAKAAADLPNQTDEQELEEKLSQRRARSEKQKKEEQQEKKQDQKQEKKPVEKLVQKQEKKQVEKVVQKREHKVEPQIQAAASQVIPVQIVLEQKPVEKSEQTGKVVTKSV